MSIVLSAIDDLSRPLHYHLTADDRCLFLREYASGQGYQYSDTNSMILNLKKGVDRRGTAEWRYKLKAIKQAGSELRGALNPKWLTVATMVPIPPSKARNDPDYDDRMRQVLQAMDRDSTLDIRDILSVAASTTSAHLTDATRDADAIAANYRIDSNLVDPLPKVVGLVDDVLTTGAHFVAAKKVLGAVWPGVEVIGLFVARRIFAEPETAPFDR